MDGTFYEKKLQKANQTGFTAERIIKRKGNKIGKICKMGRL